LIQLGKLIGGPMPNRLNNLIERAKKNERLKHYVGNVIDDEKFNNVSKNLGITLPKDFIEINKMFRYDAFSMQEFLDFAEEIRNYGIIKNNLELRKEFAYYSNGKSNMSHILVLADDDGGSVFMITQDSPEKPTPVIWCDAGDMFNYSVTGQFRNPHDEWSSFTDFFEYLVEKEEEKLRENNS
jgi:hypothetical protein